MWIQIKLAQAWHLYVLTPLRLLFAYVGMPGRANQLSLKWCVLSTGETGHQKGIPHQIESSLKCVDRGHRYQIQTRSFDSLARNRTVFTCVSFFQTRWQSESTLMSPRSPQNLTQRMRAKSRTKVAAMRCKESFQTSLGNYFTDFSRKLICSM